jgi:hypothetical protein
LRIADRIEQSIFVVGGWRADSMVEPVDVFTYAVAAVLVGGAVWWVLSRWLPDGALDATLTFRAYESGVSRRETLPAVVVASLSLAPVVANGPDSVGFGWAIATGIFAGGLLVGATAIANRPRANLLEAGSGDGLPTNGPCAVGGTAAADGETLTTPVTGRDAVCYTASVAQYKQQPLRPYGTYFTTDFTIERTPFAVETDDGTANVDPEGAWLSLAAGSPTDTETLPEGTTTGGPAEHELVVEEGEPVPEHLRGDRAPFPNLPLTTDGRAERELRFKENVVEPGESVVVAGEATVGEEYGRPLLTCEREGAFVARGPYEEVAAGLRKATGRNIWVGAVLSVLGAAGIVLLAL